MTVRITDQCSGRGGKTHFELSDVAFDSIAAPGKGAELRKMGIVPISFQRYFIISTLYSINPSINFISPIFNVISMVFNLNHCIVVLCRLLCGPIDAEAHKG